VIAATHCDLESEVRAGRFRGDLYHRLAVFVIRLPTLSERGGDDIMALARDFLSKSSGESDRSAPSIDERAEEAMLDYPWPGNVRELENAMERALLLADGLVIRREHLPPQVQHPPMSIAKDVEASMVNLDITDTGLDLTTWVASMETRMINEALRLSRGNQTRAAERLGLTKRTMQYKIRQYQIDWKRFR
jgi:DNA-binding NtrC family response regulator